MAIWQMNEPAGFQVMVESSGKGHCDQVEVTGDYFTGDIDYLRIETS